MKTLLLTALLLAAPAHAALHCEPRPALRARVRSCEDNAAYSDAARLCTDRFEQAVKAAQAEVAKKLEAVSAADRQAQGLANADAGYRLAQARLEALASEGKALRAEVKAYKEEVVWPDDFGSTPLPADVFLGEQSCYASTQKLLDSYAELLRLQVRQLQVSSAATKGLAGRAKGGETKLDAAAPGVAPAPAKPTKGLGQGKGPQAPGGESDITGTGREQKKP